MSVSLNSPAGKWVMVAAILASAMAFIDATALNVVLPSLQKSLNATGPGLFWVLNAYLLMLAALILIGGLLGDKYGRKKIFMAGILIFLIGSAACGLAPNLFFLVLFRLLQGAGGALMIPGSLSLISSLISPAERGKAIGTWSAFTTVVTMGGPVLGGALADAGLWRYIFFINVPLGIAALLMLRFKVAEDKISRSNPPLDIPGAVTIALALACLTFGFLRLPALGFVNWQVYLALLTGLLLIVSFIIIQRKSSHPMMPPALFKNKVFTGANLLTFFLYGGLGAGMLFLGLNLVQAQGYSQFQSGLTFLPFTLLMITLARYAGGLADKHGPRWLLVGGPAVTGVGLMLLSLVKQTTGPGQYWVTFLPGVAILGLGMSFTVAPLTTAVMSSASEHFSGAASGINNAMTRIAGVFANAIFGALAVLFFTGALQKQLPALHLNNQQQTIIMKQSANLGNAKATAVFGAQQQKVQQAYRDSFISAYGHVMQLSAALAFTGALMVLVFIRDKK